MIVDKRMLERVIRDSRFDERTVEIARKLFIENQSATNLAKEYAVIRQRIYAIRAAVIKQAKKYELPEGWSEVTLRGPTQEVDAIEKAFTKRMLKHRARYQADDQAEDG